MSGVPVPGRATILLVEDDDIDVEALTRVFRKRQIANPLRRAATGVEALTILRGEGGADPLTSPYILLVDINMPQMNGLDFLAEVRADETLKDSIAFVLTTSSREADITRAYTLNSAGYFLKNHISDLAALLAVYNEINCFP